MPAPSKSFTVIPDSSIDPDSPVTTELMTEFRDNDIHLEEWLGKNYTAAVDHDHDGANSKSVLASGGIFDHASVSGYGAITIPSGASWVYIWGSSTDPSGGTAKGVGSLSIRFSDLQYSGASNDIGGTGSALAISGNMIPATNLNFIDIIAGVVHYYHRVQIDAGKTTLTFSLSAGTGSVHMIFFK